MTEPIRCDYCGGLASRCVAIRDDARWISEHAARPDVEALREQQRQVRIALGHESESGGGIRRELAFTRGLSEPDDPDAVMLEAIARRRRGY